MRLMLPNGTIINSNDLNINLTGGEEKGTCPHCYYFEYFKSGDKHVLNWVCDYCIDTNCELKVLDSCKKVSRRV